MPKPERTNTSAKVFQIGVTVAMVVLLGTAVFSHAFTLGETYDKSNAEQIKEMLPEPVYKWVKKGDFILQTRKLNFEWKFEQEYIDRSNANAGKYDINDKGWIVDKGTNKIPGYITGNPFPGAPDTNDPKVAEKIMANFKWTSYRSGAFMSGGDVNWIGRRGHERRMIVGGAYLAYQNRPRGPIPNPNNFLYQNAQFVVSPMDLRGTVSMAWNYNEDKMDTAFAYVPMLRRVRRVSAASRSAPFLGSDFCADDSFLWTGKNATMNWKLLGETTVIAPFTSPDMIPIVEREDGTLVRKFAPFKVGYTVPGWQGAPWAPVDLTWTPRDTWIIEATPKDDYYNYGRMIYYVDKVTYQGFYKLIYDRAGAYWKTVFIHSSYQVSQKGTTLIPQADGYAVVNDRTDHANYTHVVFIPELKSNLLNMAVEVMGPRDFTVSAIQQMTK
jgi:hypothetical protein